MEIETVRVLGEIALKVTELTVYISLKRKKRFILVLDEQWTVMAVTFSVRFP